MTEATLKTLDAPACPHVESVAAYLDGEMCAATEAAFESHAKDCRACSEGVKEQRRLLCLLDTAFDERAASKLDLPDDFARVVTARAKTDMCGLRARSERAFSLKLSLLLAACAGLVIVASASDEALAPLAAVARALSTVADVTLHALSDASRGALIILRTLGGSIVAIPNHLAVAYWLLFAGAFVLLLRLIRSYHRAR